MNLLSTHYKYSNTCVTFLNKAHIVQFKEGTISYTLTEDSRPFAPFERKIETANKTFASAFDWHTYLPLSETFVGYHRICDPIVPFVHDGFSWFSFF